MQKKMSLAATQPEMKLAGIDLGRDINSTGEEADRARAEIWQRFQDEDIAGKIQNKISDQIILVSYRPRRPPVYQDPFRYYMAVPVENNDNLPKGIEPFTLPAGAYHKFTVENGSPESVSQKWSEILDSDIERSFEPDYEIYNENSMGTAANEVDIYVAK
ncbi:MAG: GyrI-like domain-containing protein [Balneolia bacterium]|nr:GyrI-like domain-containing protein [Balneolia bacterium]